MSFRVWLDRGIASKQTPVRKYMFTIALWWIWKWTNELVFSNSIQPLHSKIQWINIQVKEVNAAFARIKTHQGISNIGSWGMYSQAKPEDGIVKINFDGAIDHAASTAGCGGVIRDSMGSWLGGFVSKIGSCSPLQLEAWALLRRVQLAKLIKWAAEKLFSKEIRLRLSTV